MAYALRYYKEIAQEDGGVVRLEIHKKDSTTSAVEIGAVVQGLSLEIQGQQNDIDTPIQKTSLSMTFVDAGDIEDGRKNGFWEEFHTPDALLWKVILKARNAKETSFRTIWGGYVTPDSFSEDLVYRGSINIIARDNIGHMQDFPFDAVGDADGLISLYNLISMGWEKIQSPMSLSWTGMWLESDGVIAYETLMNVSQFQGKDWYKAIETALASYGAVMRYVGGNTVVITTLRSLPSQGGDINILPRIEPTFVSGAQRELVPAVKRIEESVRYKLEDSWSIPQIQPSDFTGNIYTYKCKVDGETWGTVEHEAPVWAIPINVDRGWDNFPSESLFFNIDAYEVGYFSDHRGLGEEMKRYMYIAANNVDDRSVWYSKQITCADVSVRIKFGLPVCLNRNNEVEQMSVFALKSIRYTISLKQDGSVLYYAGGGTWEASEKVLEKTYDITANETEFVEQVGMDDNLGVCDLVFEIKKVEYAKVGYGAIANIGLYACIQDIAFTTASTSSFRETNTVNTSYNSDNNVILSRDPELGPAFDKVAIPAFIKNGIFYRNVDDEILPARLWSWGGSEQQMAVWNHLQLLCYYAKPNNLISGTIVNADLTRVANIWLWHGAEHILISGTYNFLSGMIEGAVLREFARYEDMWSEVAGAAMPDTEQDSRSNVESGSGTSSNAPTYTSTTNVNVGGGGSATYLSELLDVDLTGLTAKSVLYYDGEKWVDRNIQDLVGWHIDPDTGALTTDKDVVIKGNLFLDGDEASMGDGDDEVKGTVRGIKVSSSTTLYPESDGIINMAEFFSDLSFDVDLSGYYTSKQVDDLLANDYVAKGRKISAGTGLTGGGDLSDDITLSLAKVGTAGTYAKVVVDAYGRVTGSASLGTGDIPTIAISKVSGLQAALDNKVNLAGDQTITGAKTFSALATFNKGMVITGDVTINGNLFLTGDEASMGDGGSGTGGGMNETELENYLKDNDYLFGSINGGREANVYAPTSGGTNGHVLVSSGNSSAPVWKSVDDLGISGSAFEGGYIPTHVWFSNGQGIVTYNGRYNIINGTDGNGGLVAVGASGIPYLRMRAATNAETIIGADLVTRVRADSVFITKTTLISQDSSVTDDDIAAMLPDIYEGSTWDLIVRGESLFCGGVNFYNSGISSHFRLAAVGTLLSLSVNHYPDDISNSQYIYTFSSAWSRFYTRLILEPSTDNVIRTLQIIDANGTTQNIGIDANSNLVYNDNIILHSGNYTDYISGGNGADLSSYYTKEEAEARFMTVNGGTISGTSFNIVSASATSGISFITALTGGTLGSIAVTSLATTIKCGLSAYISISAYGAATVNGNTILHSGNYTDYISESGGSADGDGSTAGAASPPMMVFTGLSELSDFTENGIANGQVLLLQTTSTVGLQTIFKAIFPKTDSDGNRLSTTIYIKARSGYETGKISVPVYRSSGIILSNPSSTGAILNNSAAYTLVLGFGTIMLTHCGEYWVANLIA